MSSGSWAPSDLWQLVNMEHRNEDGASAFAHPNLQVKDATNLLPHGLMWTPSSPQELAMTLVEVKPDKLEPLRRTTFEEAKKTVGTWTCRPSGMRPWSRR